MNDLRRGSLFGRQGKVPQQQEQKELTPSQMHPPSFTNITFKHTKMSTASQLSSFDGKPMELDQKSQKSGFSESTKTGIPMSAKGAPRGRSANSAAAAAAAKPRHLSPAAKIEDMKKREAKQKQMDEAAAAAAAAAGNKDFSKKSMKKSKKSIKSMKKSIKSSGKSRFGGIEEKGKAQKSKKSMKKSRKSGKSLSKKGVKAPGDIDFPSPKSSKKVQKVPNKSVYLPGVMDGQAPSNKFLNQQDPAKSQKSTKAVRKFNEIPAYHFPGAGKCTRSMDQVAPPTPKNAPDQSHCVYDVAQLPAAQRRVPPKCVSGRAPPKSCFGNKRLIQSTQRRPKPVAHPAAGAPAGAASGAPGAPVLIPSSAISAQQQSPQTAAAAPTNTKIVIFGKTADGKNTIQMTIDMQIVAGEALGGSDKPIQVIPQKILVAGKEVPLDGYSSKSGGGTPPQ